jgi:hypothetical protein
VAIIPKFAKANIILPMAIKAPVKPYSARVKEEPSLVNNHVLMKPMAKPK